MEEMHEIVILLYGLEVDYFSSFKFLLGSFLRFWQIQPYMYFITGNHNFHCDLKK